MYQEKSGNPGQPFRFRETIICRFIYLYIFLSFSLSVILHFHLQSQLIYISNIHTHLQVP
jgi:hypothetical protein